MPNPTLCRATVALCLFVETASASARASVPPLVFGPGEQSTYKVKYLGVAAGTAVITVGDTAQAGKAVWPIVTMANSGNLLTFFPIRDKLVTYFDAAQGQTVSQEMFIDENHKRRRQKFVLDQVGHTAVVTKQKEGEASNEAKMPIQPGTQDLTAATFEIRNQLIGVGQVMTAPVFTGNKIFPLRATVLSKEKLDTPLGEREVFKVRVQTDFSGKLQSKRDLFAYFTTDASHIPVRIEADFLLGTIVAELTDYKQGHLLASAQRSSPVR